MVMCEWCDGEGARGMVRRSVGVVSGVMARMLCPGAISGLGSVTPQKRLAHLMKRLGTTDGLGGSERCVRRECWCGYMSGRRGKTIVRGCGSDDLTDLDWLRWRQRRFGKSGRSRVVEEGR